MIVKMKKIFVIAQTKDIAMTVDQLRAVGVVHVDVSPHELSNESLNSVREEYEQVSAALNAVDQIKGDKIFREEATEHVSEKTHEILELLRKAGECEENAARFKILNAKWDPWGEFDPRDIVWLRERGIRVILAELTKEHLARLPEDVVVRVINRLSGVSRCFLIAPMNWSAPFEEMDLPPSSLSALRLELCSQQEQLKEIHSKLCELKKFSASLRVYQAQCGQKLRFESVAAGMAQEGELAFLKGFCPVDALSHLEDAVKKYQWGLLTEDPASDDPVPTLLRNPKWVNIIKPVFDMIGVLPGYREFDVSFFLLVFFSLFFGILVGDAGYGLMFLVATIWGHVKLHSNKETLRPIFLMYVLSTVTIVWGLLTGVFFGQEWLIDRVQPLCPWLNDIQNIQWLCFMIGAVHLTIAHAWRFLVKMPSLDMLSELGWICIVWVMNFAANLFVLGLPFPSFGMPLLIVGFVLVFLFRDTTINIRKLLSPDLIALLLSIISAFSDVVSYIRLFAVGLASVAVADAFNQMAMGIGFDGPVSGLIAALILVVGHVFNIVLGAMGLLVHGIRLNVLEFSGHLGLEWTGTKYDPFEKKDVTI